MNKKIGTMITISLLILVIVPVAGKNTGYSVNDKQSTMKIIEETKDKNLVYEGVIGDVIVNYWEHVIDGSSVKNDSILLHLDVKNNEIVKFKKSWSTFDNDQLTYFNHVFEPVDYVWKKMVVFPDEQDCGKFYRFIDEVLYPVTCLEVRHCDGSTILYGDDGSEIGYGVPAPSKGFSLSGFNDASWPDPWKEYRENADDWFKNWCSSTVSISLPSVSTISSHISDSASDYIYELAHGDEYSFQADAVGNTYYASTLQSDMQNRQPVKFAFIGNCHGMTSTGQGTFSYEFRKGQMSETVTVGFDHMEECPGWEYGWYWQDSMFDHMNNGLTIKESFDLATSEYPTIEPAVVFLGDEELVAVLISDLHCDGSLQWEKEKPNSEITGFFSLSNTGEDGSLLDWEISEYPDWGTWDFSQDNGKDLTPEDGSLNITVTVLIPDEKNAEFSDEIKIINKNDPTDYEIIPISLTTVKNNDIAFHLFRFLENHLNIMYLLREILNIA